VTPSTQRATGTIQVALDVTNTGSRAGDEIVQLYVNDEVASIVYYERVLRGFERVSLKPGEKARLRFTLTPDDLKLLDRDMKWTVEPGTFQVLVGASSEDIRLRGAFEIR
jgi:beta-glucosidase